MITLKILSENRENGKFKAEKGLSVFVNAFENKFLFDTGESNLFLKNAKLLNLNINDIEKIILSHGHNDHTNGVKFLPSGKTIILHPQIYKKRWSVRRKEFLGFDVSKSKLCEKHNVIESKEPFEFCNNCFFLGEIPMLVDFEADGNFATTIDEELTQTDYTEDDSGIAITTTQGLFIMTGCGHRGICNVIERAKKITGQEKVYGVFGGFHLRDLEKQKEKIDKTIDYFKKNNIKEIYLGHCITDDVINYFEENLEKVKVLKLASGKEFNLNLKPLKN